jgi:PhzF family phenazine biosynthesis protein
MSEDLPGAAKQRGLTFGAARGPVMRVLHLDAFSSTPGKGNPAGIVIAADDLGEAAMQAVARAVGFNETGFVLRSARADLRLRYFTPGHEVDLCGHATLAALVALQAAAASRRGGT